ncbi:MAG: tetratricopeptide repeat protein [bacterium]
MVPRKTAFLIVALTVLVCLPQKTTVAQSRNKKALEWFEAGHLETRSSKKIHAYEMAVKEDSLFVDAYYYLGMTYKSKKDYPAAGRAFHKALRIVQDGGDVNTRYRIVRQLAEMYKKVNNADQYETALRACIEFALTPSRKHEHTVSLARLLNAQNRKSEAMEALRKLQEEEGASVSDSFVGAAKVLELCYDAETALADGNLSRARGLLNQVKAASPTENRIKVKVAWLDSILLAKETELANNLAYDRALELAATGNLNEAIAFLEKVEEAPGSYKDAQLLLDRFKQARAEKRKEEELEQLAASDSQDNLPATKARATTDNRPEAGTEAESDANTNNKKALVSTKTILQKKQSPNQTGSSTAMQPESSEASLTENDPVMESGEFEIRPDKPEVLHESEEVEYLGDETMGSISVSQHRPAQANDAVLEQGVRSKRTRMFLISALSLLGILFLLAVLVIFMAPMMLARIFILFGRAESAIKLLEKVQRRSPGAMQTYPLLANLYLQTHKTSDQAIKIFKTVLKNGIKVDNMEEIYKIVEDHYTSEGAMDSDMQELIRRGPNLD